MKRASIQRSGIKVQKRLTPDQTGSRARSGAWHDLQPGGCECFPVQGSVLLRLPRRLLKMLP
jgi:hypothetical protein